MHSDIESQLVAVGRHLAAGLLQLNATMTLLEQVTLGDAAVPRHYFLGGAAGSAELGATFE